MICGACGRSSPGTPRGTCLFCGPLDYDTAVHLSALAHKVTAVGYARGGPPRPKIPDFTDYVLGIREWRLGRTGALRPRHVEMPAWADGGRFTESSFPPIAFGASGLHAYHVESAMHVLPVFGGCVAGIIQAHGVLEVHRDGFRAEYARPVALFSQRHAGLTARARVARAARRYQVPVLHFVGEAMTIIQSGEHGRPLPADLRPTSVTIGTHGHVQMLEIPLRAVLELMLIANAPRRARKGSERGRFLRAEWRRSRLWG